MVNKWMKNKSFKVLSVLLILMMVLVGCGQDTASENEMEYITKEDLKEDIDSGNGEYILLDVRQAEDYEEEHIEGAYLADQHEANKNGKDEIGVEHLEAALEEATGSKTGNEGDKYALMCYSGKSYAQKATDLLIDMDVSEDQIYTVEGGMKDWESGGDEYNQLLTK